MNTSKKLFVTLSLILILPFFLACILFISIGFKKGKLAAEYNQTFTIHVENGEATPASHAFQLFFPQDGTYQYYMSWDVEDPGFITAFVHKDPNGKKVTALTAYQTDKLPNSVATIAGNHSFELFFLDSEDALREYAKNYCDYVDGPELDKYVSSFDFSDPIKDGDRQMPVSFKVYPLMPIPFSVQLLTLCLGALILILLFLCLSKEREEDITMKERLDTIGNRHSIFLVSVILTQMIVIVILRNFFRDFLQENRISLSLILSIVAVDVVGFTLVYLTYKDVPAQPIPEKKLGIGKFLLFVLMSYGIALPLSLVGNIVHTLITLPFGGADTAIATLLMNSNWFLRILTTGICAPIFEELIFRKLLVDRLIKYGEFIAIFTSGLMFGLFHGNFQQFFFAFGIGLLFAFVYARTGRIHYTIGLHMVINMTTSVITVFVTRQYFKYASVSMSPDVHFASESSHEAYLYILLYILWHILLILLAITGVILLIVFMAKKKFRLRRFEGEATKSEALKVMFSSKLMLVFLLGTLGMFLMSYLPVFLRG